MHIATNPDSIKSTSLKSAAYKIDHEPDVNSRIIYLRTEYAARLDVPETLTATDIRDLMHEVTACLELAHDTAEGSVASESDLSKIRQRLTIHIGSLRVAPRPSLKRPSVGQLWPSTCRLGACAKSVMSDHAQATLARLIKRSVASLRLAVEDLRVEADKVSVQRVVEECDTVSSGVAQLARHVDLSKLDPPMPVERAQGGDLLDEGMRIIAAVERGFCPVCGGVPKADTD